MSLLGVKRARSNTGGDSPESPATSPGQEKRSPKRPRQQHPAMSLCKLLHKFLVCRHSSLSPRTQNQRPESQEPKTRDVSQRNQKPGAQCPKTRCKKHLPFLDAGFFEESVSVDEEQVSANGQKPTPERCHKLPGFGLRTGNLPVRAYYSYDRAANVACTTIFRAAHVAVAH